MARDHQRLSGAVGVLGGMVDLEVVRFEIARLVLEPGQTLVVKTPETLTHDDLGRVAAAFKGVVPPGVDVIVIKNTVDLQILGVAPSSPAPPGKRKSVSHANPTN